MRALSVGVMGIAATLGIDLWSLLLRKAFDIPSLDYRLLGRWILHMPEGKFAHDGIAKSPARPHERIVGWAAHYSIGIGFAAAFTLLAGSTWLDRPTFWPALAFGVVTVVAPFFTMQPAFGLGIGSSRAKNPAAARLKSLATHAVFGVGLYLSAYLLTPL